MKGLNNRLSRGYITLSAIYQIHGDPEEQYIIKGPWHHQYMSEDPMVETKGSQNALIRSRLVFADAEASDYLFTSPWPVTLGFIQLQRVSHDSWVPSAAP